MDRREFIKTTGVLGLGAAFPGIKSNVRQKSSTGFLTEKSSDRMLFPRPLDGAELKI